MQCCIVCLVLYNDYLCFSLKVINEFISSEVKVEKIKSSTSSAEVITSCAAACQAVDHDADHETPSSDLEDSTMSSDNPTPATAIQSFTSSRSETKPTVVDTAVQARVVCTIFIT